MEIKNLFEEVIDKMMVDNIDGLSDEVKKSIMNLPTDKKRLAILSILDRNRDLFLKIKGLTDKSINRMDHIKDVILMLRNYVKVGEVEQKKFGEVMTPLDLVKEMLSTLPEEVWSNPNLKWLDPANGTGPFPSMVIYRLMRGLEKWEPDAEKRYRHIVENMIYVCELQPKNMFLYMCAVDPFDEYKLNVYTGSFLESGFDKHMEEVWKLEKFDIVIGNPPYQEQLISKKGSAKPLYNIFTEKSVCISKIVIFITPSRWFAGGKGLDQFRKMMIESRKVSMIKHFNDPTELFGKSVEIKGGVSYFIFDNSHDGVCEYNSNKIDLSKFDILVESKFYSILSKTLTHRGLSEICKGQSYSGITSNDSRLLDQPIEGSVKCYVSQQKGFVKWIPKSEIKTTLNLNLWKVITAEASGSNKKLGVFGNTFIGEPGEICNQSYDVFEVSSKSEAESLLSYLNTKFANCMLSLRKISQHIKPDTCKWIPILPLDRLWDDNKIFEYFGFNSEEIYVIMNYDLK